MNTPIPCRALPTPSPPPEPETYYQHIQKPLTPEPESIEEKVTCKPTTRIPLRKTPQLATKWLNVIQKLLKDLDGRDKIMKTIQYFIKILLHYKLVDAKFLSTITSNFSMTRKLLRLGSGLGPMREIVKLKSSLYETFVLTNAIVNHISDDIFCLHKLGVFGSYLGDRTERISAYCWFTGILIDLRENTNSLVKLQGQEITSEEQLEAQRQKIHVTEISIIKLLMDGIFCGKFFFKK